MLQSAKKTGRIIIAHEAPMTNGFGAEIAATVQVREFLLSQICDNNKINLLRK